MEKKKKARVKGMEGNGEKGNKKKNIIAPSLLLKQPGAFWKSSTVL